MTDPVQFEWDEVKRRSNISKHGLDFADAWEVLDGEHLVLPTYAGSDRARHFAIGRIGTLHVVLIYTQRSDVTA